MPPQDYRSHRTPGEAQKHRERSLLLWAEARAAHSPEARTGFERLAQLYERMAVRADRRESKISTLGELLCADTDKRCASEAEWVGLVRATADGDYQAFQTLHLWAHRLVFSWLAAITNDTVSAEELALSVFHDVWRRAATYDPAAESVVAWIMRQARLMTLHGQTLDDRTGLGLAGAPLSSSAVLEALELFRTLRKGIPVPDIEYEPGMDEPAPGIFCKLLATDLERSRLSMLVRLAPGINYPPHTHADVEELYLLRGELWINDRRLYPGDYNRAERGTSDKRVWSETGCICILLTSSGDRIE